MSVGSQKIELLLIFCYMYKKDRKMENILVSKGSTTAKNGLKEEQDIVDMLNESQKMREDIAKLSGNQDTSSAYLEKNSKIKSDYHVCGRGVSHKKTKLKQFQQAARHNVSLIIQKIPELKPVESMLINLCEKSADGKIVKLSAGNYSEAELESLISAITINKRAIIEFILLGDITEKPELFSYSVFDKNNIRKEVAFFKMSDVIDFYMTQPVSIRKSKTVIDFGNGLTFQRKGGDGGKPSANQCQFKIVPTNLSILENKCVFYS